MEIYIKFKNYFFDIFDRLIPGLTILEVLIIIFSFILSLFIRNYFAKIIVFKIKKIFQNSQNKDNEHFFENLIPPLRTIPVIFVFVLIGLLVDADSQIGKLIKNINQTLLTIVIFWILHQALTPLSQIFNKLEKLLSKAMVQWLIKSLKYLIIFLGVVAVLETWGIKIGPIIAGLGLFGVAVALGAQDLFKNLISGIMIILEKRFELNDIIQVPGHATGTVEHIGFRSTLIRQFDSTPISIPNYVFSDTPIINFSDRHYRRINWIIGLTYATSVNQLKNICNEIESYIRSSNNFTVNDNYKLNVRVEKFNNSSIDILINTFTNTNDWEKFLIIKEELVFFIKDIVNQNNSSFAFPSHSIYMENSKKSLQD